MSFPTSRSVILTNGTSASATPVVNLPATVVAGDTLLVVIRNATAGVIGWPDGTWNELHDGSPDGSVGQTAIAWKKAVGNEGGTTITLSSGNGKFAAAAWSIQDAADPAVRAPEISTVAIGTTGEPDATTCTPTGGTKDYFWLTVFSMEGEQTGITAYPASFTLGQSGLASSGTAAAVTTNATVAGAGRQSAASSLDAGVWDVAGTLDDSSAWTIAFHPGNMTPASAPSESSKVVDTVVAILTTLLLTVPAEAAKVSDSVSAETITSSYPVSVTNESTKVDDGGGVGLQGLGNPIKITDGPVLAERVGNDLSRQITSENVKANDGLVAYLSLHRSAAPEAVEIDDGGRVDIFGLGNPIKITDSIFAMLVGDELAPSLLQEGIRVSDADLTVRTVLSAFLSEALSVVDAVSVVLNPERATPSETSVTDDGGFVELRGLGNPIKITDGPIIAVRTSGNELIVSPPLSEALKVTDSITVARDLTTTITESIKVADSGEVELSRDETIRISYTLEVVRFSEGTVSESEQLKVVDAVSVTINPEQAVPSESLKITDAVTVALDRSTTVSESLKISETLTLTLNPEQAAPLESLKVVDTPSVIRIDEGTLVAPLEVIAKVVDSIFITLNPEQAAASESLKVVDTVVVSIGVSATTSETLKVVDTTVVSLNPEQTTLTESRKIVDTVAAELLDGNTFVVSLTESLRVIDAVTTTGFDPTVGHSSVGSGLDVFAEASAGLDVFPDVGCGLDIFPEPTAGVDVFDAAGAGLSDVQ